MAEKTDGHRPLTGTATPRSNGPAAARRPARRREPLRRHGIRLGRARQSFGDLDDPRSRFVFENGWPDERYRIHCGGCSTTRSGSTAPAPSCSRTFLQLLIRSESRVNAYDDLPVEDVGTQRDLLTLHEDEGLAQH